MQITHAARCTLLDGRSVYSPLNSTVFRDVLDTFMEDIDRIEVIRGPGATLWGANAVNGVINIVTKHSKETLGTLVRAGAGNEEPAAAAFRAGTTIGEAGHGRLYAKAFERDASLQRTGGDTFDGQRQGQAGFRTDWNPAEGHDLTVSGDFHEGRQTTKDLALRGAPRHRAEAGSAPSGSTPNPPPPATEIERAIWLDVIWQWQ